MLVWDYVQKYISELYYGENYTALPLKEKISIFLIV